MLYCVTVQLSQECADKISNVCQQFRCPIYDGGIGLHVTVLPSFRDGRRAKGQVLAAIRETCEELEPFSITDLEPVIYPSRNRKSLKLDVRQAEPLLYIQECCYHRLGLKPVKDPYPPHIHITQHLSRRTNGSLKTPFSLYLRRLEVPVKELTVFTRRHPHQRWEELARISL